MRPTLLAQGAVVLVGLSIAGVVTHAEIIEQILVKVNGEVFTKTDLENRQVSKLRELQGQKVDLKTDGNDQELRKMLDQVTPALLVRRGQSARCAARQGVVAVPESQSQPSAGHQDEEQARKRKEAFRQRSNRRADGSRPAGKPGTSDDLARVQQNGY